MSCFEGRTADTVSAIKGRAPRCHKVNHSSVTTPRPPFLTTTTKITKVTYQGHPIKGHRAQKSLTE